MSNVAASQSRLHAELTAVAETAAAEAWRQSHSISSSSGAGIAVGSMPPHAAMPGGADGSTSGRLDGPNVMRGSTAAGWHAAAAPDCRLALCSCSARSPMVPPYAPLPSLKRSAGGCCHECMPPGSMLCAKVPAIQSIEHEHILPIQSTAPACKVQDCRLHWYTTGTEHVHVKADLVPCQ